MRRKKPKAGDKVIQTGLPPGFLDNLPQEDQRAISAVVGKRVRLDEYDEGGRAELEFKERNNSLHLLEAKIRKTRKTRTEGRLASILQTNRALEVAGLHAALFEILLVIVFGAVKLGRRRDVGHNRALELA